MDDAKLRMIIKEIFKELLTMSKEDFDKLITDNEPTCRPETCSNECLGSGWCEVSKRLNDKLKG